MISLNELQKFLFNKLLNSNGNFLRGRVRESYLIRYYPEEYKSIIFHTSFLDNAAPLLERLVCVKFLYRSKPKCPCGNTVKFHKALKNYATFCSTSCIENTAHVKNIKIKNNLIKYGVKHHWCLPEIKEKCKQTFLKKYGVENPNLNPTIIEKKKKTCNERYSGNAPLCSEKIKQKVKESWASKDEKELSDINKRRVESYNLNKDKHVEKIIETWHKKTISQIADINEKRKDTNLKKYGLDDPNKSEQYKDLARIRYFSKSEESRERELQKARETTFRKYGRYNYNQRHIDLKIIKFRNNKAKYKRWLEILHHRKKLTIHEIAHILHIDPTIISKEAQELGIEIKFFFRSSIEKEIVSFVKSLTSNILLNNRTCIGEELDIFIPDKKIAIELDGLYWHSYSKLPSSKEKEKHYRKTKKCRDLSIKLFHIFENEWINPQLRRIWQSRLKRELVGSETRIFARDTVVKTVTYDEANKFLDSNHLQGKVIATISYGLYTKADPEKLVAIMSFTRKSSKNNKWDLSRYCNLLNISVVGGASKLLHYFENNNKWDEISSFADLRYSYGALYPTLGFIYTSEVRYSYYYTDKIGLFHKRNFQKQYLSKLLGDKYDPAKTEFDNVLGSGMYRILYDCGKLKFIKRNPIYATR